MAEGNHRKFVVQAYHKGQKTEDMNDLSVVCGGRKGWCRGELNRQSKEWRLRSNQRMIAPTVVDLAVAHHKGRRNRTETSVARRRGSHRVVDEGDSLTFLFFLSAFEEVLSFLFAPNSC